MKNKSNNYHSFDAEIIVLGSLIIDNSCMTEVNYLLVPSDFFYSNNRAIYSHIEMLFEKGLGFDVLQLSESMEQANTLDHAGGLIYLHELQQNTPTPQNIRAHANIVKQQSILRYEYNLQTEREEEWKRK